VLKYRLACHFITNRKRKDCNNLKPKQDIVYRRSNRNMFFNTFKELEDNLQANTVKGLHKECTRTSTLHLKMTRNSEAGFTSVM